MCESDTCGERFRLNLGDNGPRRLGGLRTVLVLLTLLIDPRPTRILGVHTTQLSACHATCRVL